MGRMVEAAFTHGGPNYREMREAIHILHRAYERVKEAIHDTLGDGDDEK